MKILIKPVALLLFFNFFFYSYAPAAFLNPWPSSRAAGKGGAFIAGADDSSAAAWNPAGLALLDKGEVLAEYYRPFAGLEGVNLGSGYFSASYPISSLGTAAASYGYFYGDGIYYESSLSVSLGRPLAGGVYGGAGIKYLYRSYSWGDLRDPIVLEGNSAGAITADLGFSLKIGTQAGAGAVIKNLIPADLGLKEEDIVPFEAGIGAYYNLGEYGAFKEIIPEAALRYRDQGWGGFGDKADLSLGAEAWTAGRVLGVRLGVNQYEAAAGGSYLASIGLLSLRLDYTALFPFSSLTGHMGHHRITLSLKDF